MFPLRNNLVQEVGLNKGIGRTIAEEWAQDGSFDICTRFSRAK
jgi:hypothetical protein